MDAKKLAKELLKDRAGILDAYLKFRFTDPATVEKARSYIATHLPHVLAARPDDNPPTVLAEVSVLCCDYVASFNEIYIPTSKAA